ncbi:hypothetical protein ALI22I_19995 [Saccharothrix sp. ALI-22-I]|uniref:hypothetical protein n=1 Tax=Saccharothrix sp. ALI-22-I TaxID=1933778 RepID=UPI00097CAF8D|nr:hypothetical protein [Saccharothrix sp. ALI-22-I]ONI88029.1 hypothetical protein ALI22I_19995 [Saccharothrix sp. ALI-22-I]
MNDDTPRLTAARARARQSVLAHERAPLAALEPSLWRLAGTDGSLRLTIAEDLQLHDADLSRLAVARLSEGQARTLLAVLVVTRRTATNSAHPYPGVTASVDDVFAVLGASNLGRHAEAPIKGALNKLHSWQLVRLGEDDADPVSAEAGVAVRLGTAVSLWAGPWVADLIALVDGLVDRHGRSR